MSTGLRFDGMVIFCADIGAATKFYADGLGLVQDWAAEDHVGFHLPTGGNPTGAWLLLHQQTEAITPYELGTFGVDDVDATVARIEAAGYPVKGRPADAPWGVRQAWLTDPDGYGLTLNAPLNTPS